MIRVVLPYHLSTLAEVSREVELDVELDVEGRPPTQRRVIDALEAAYPVLRGTLRDPTTQRRRPFIRFFACDEDLSLQSPDTPLPEAVARGDEPLHVVGAMAGG